jgi:hypothetical protein
MWRGDRGASCTPSGKGQGGVVAVYLIKVSGRCRVALEKGGARLTASGTGAWLNTRTTPPAALY